IGLGHFASKRFEEALPKLLFAIQEDANFPVIYRYLAACYAHLGQLSEARKTVERLRAICPTIGSDSYFRKPEHQELYLSGLRLAIGDTGEEQRLIRTVPRVGVVTCEAENVKDVRASTASTPKPLPLPDKPSIAVLPFDNMSGDPEQEYFADGMVEEIITALSRFRQL